MPGGGVTEGTVSVVIPTYHRPDMLGVAARSVLAQQVPPGWQLELVVAVSDAASDSDRRAAEAIAATDGRVKVAVADRLGPGSARNAGIEIATGSVIALLDDDCQAQPGWLLAGLAKIDEVGLVQGRTVPGEPVTHPFDRTINIERLSGLWESCNLFVQRSVIETHGAFDEEWNPTGRPGEHWGEDTEWGWRVVRGGTTAAFEPAALVHHAVFKQDFRQWLRYETKVRYFPYMVKEIPELRSDYLYERYFFLRRHRTMTAGVALLAAAGVAAAAGRPRTARAAALLAVAPLGSAHARTVFYLAQKEWVHYAALAYGTVKYRRVVL